MKTLTNLYKQIASLLHKKAELVMVTILNKTGSAPREKGAKMLVTRGFTCIGSVGDGILGAMTMQVAAEVFENRGYIIKDFTLSVGGKTIGEACGGEVQLLFEYLNPLDLKLIEMYDMAKELSEQGVDFFVMTKLSRDNIFITGSDKWICTETGIYGIEDIEIPKIKRTLLEDFRHLKLHMHQIKADYLVEPVYSYDRVIVIGAGNIAKQLVHYLNDVGFYTIVIDDEIAFANDTRFPRADECLIVKDYDLLTNQINIDEDTYVAIVTRGHKYDFEVLAQMLKTKAKYIGMLGSTERRDRTYELLYEAGFTAEDIKRVRCPIGLAISAETNEEIAISIAAEMVSVRRGNTN